MPENPPYEPRTEEAKRFLEEMEKATTNEERFNIIMEGLKGKIILYGAKEE